MTNREDEQKSTVTQAATRHGIRKSFDKFATHPLSSTVVVFLLMGLIATSFSKWLDTLAQQREIFAAAHSRAVESVRHISELLYERRTRSVLLVSAIRRHAKEDEVNSRKAAYDDVYTRWNSTIQSNLFLIREITGAHDYSEYEYVQERQVVPVLNSIDKCITNAFDKFVSDSDEHVTAIQILDQCKIDDLLTISIRCLYNYTDILYTTVQARVIQNDMKQIMQDVCGQKY